jgi:uncharacterized protein YcgI (DUF1989 family)
VHRAQSARQVFHARKSGADRRHLEFFAEIDLLCALSTCPGGDLSVPLWGPDARDPLEVCRPLGIEVYALDRTLLKDFRPPPVAAYKGAHGLRLPKAAWER